MAELAIVTLSITERYVRRLSAALAGDAPSWPAPVERVLVNNAATPADADRHPLTRLGRDAGWRVLTPGHNASFSAGNNLAVRSTDAPWVLLLNDDVMPHAGAIAALWAHRDAADVHGALMLYSDGTVNHNGSRLLPTPDHLDRGAARETIGAGLAPREAVTFAVALIRRAWWDALGGLDERFDYGFEDTDFCVRTLLEGGRITVNRDAVFTHDEFGTRARGGAQERRNLERFRNKWRGRLPAIVADATGGEAPRRPGRRDRAAALWRSINALLKRG